ncbi:hypothetical protein SK128_000021 [Halocaridina rubra]|uniref:Uncharacterized protein n=1 Tax=Halocaridina rubra TaxID=373956 RepID=A0AAN9AE02_HALRR
MKFSGRALELNCAFLLVVVLLIALQIFLQNAQKKLREGVVNEKGGDLLSINERNDVQDILGDYVQTDKEQNVDTISDLLTEENLAAPLVPNIRKSFPKRKAPYLRRGKKNKKKKQNRAKKNNGQKSKPFKEDTKPGAGFKKGKHPNMFKQETKFGKQRQHKEKMNSFSGNNNKKYSKNH